MREDSEGALEDVLTLQTLRDYADSRSYHRGEEYFHEKRVSGLTDHQGKIIATVHGTRKYRVTLWEDDGELGYSCTCPVGESGDFCKHCVAVGLTWLEGGATSPVSSKAKTTFADVEKYLSSLPSQELAGMLMEQVRNDERLRERLFLKVARLGKNGFDMDTYVAALEDAFTISDYEEYLETWEYPDKIEEVINTMEELLQEGFAAETMELVEKALSLAEENAELNDDSVDYIAGIMERIKDIHLRTCLAARPDPKDLAGKLFQWAMDSGWGFFDDSIEYYAEVLGKTGIEEYYRLVREEWEKIPVLKPGMEDRKFTGHRHYITSIMESIARESGDLDEIVAVKSRDLSSSHSFFDIANTCREYQKYDQAIEWAVKGLEAFPKQDNSYIRIFLAEEYHRAGRHDEEMDVIWENFIEQPYLCTYQALHSSAQPTGWGKWREKAITHVRNKLAKERKNHEKQHHNWAFHGDNSLLVEIFLWEGDVESAWKEAQKGGCSQILRLELAEKRAEAHPEDTVDVYRRYIQDTVMKKNNDAYSEAVMYMQKTRNIMHRMEKDDEFSRYLAEVRAAHKPKRNFMKLLDEEKWK